ncbi:MAG: OadG family protein [Clostridiales bacterium]|nr:OadG family protein [Clostridiales bacterium]
MINNFLSLLNQEGSLELGEACLYALIGFAVVFAGIVIIILIIWLIGLLMRKTDNLAFLNKIGKKRKKVKEQVIEDRIPEEEISPEVRAAIVAAIMAYYTAEKPKCEFKVKRIKKI